MLEQSDAEPKKQDQVKEERKVPTAMSHHPSAGTLRLFHAPAMAYVRAWRNDYYRIEEARVSLLCELDTWITSA